MELQLKNVGMIKEANVKIDGLTVIAGENDTGKSTVGKALFLSFHALPTNNDTLNSLLQIDTYESLIILPSIFGVKSIPKFAEIKLIYKNKYSQLNSSGFTDGELTKDDIGIKSAIFVESPLIWNFTDFFRDIAQVESQMNIKLDYPYLMKDLSFKLHIKSASKGLDIKDKVTSLMGGEFKKDESDHYYFDKSGQRVELVNTATGIKQFAIFQVLSQNNWLNKDTVLILDEPEVHLHPKWQLEMAKIVVELVKNGVKVLVNSHSPYMIQSLIKYVRDEKVVDKSNFYLAKKEKTYSIIENVNDDLNKIFKLLAEPMNEVFTL